MLPTALQTDHLGMLKKAFTFILIFVVGAALSLGDWVDHCFLLDPHTAFVHESQCEAAQVDLVFRLMFVAAVATLAAILVGSRNRQRRRRRLS